MAEVMMQHATSPNRKRNHEGDLLGQDTSFIPNTVAADDTSTNTTSRQASPASSSAISELTELTSDTSSPAPQSTILVSNHGASDNSTPVKRRKLTFAEKEVEKAVKKREKEEKERMKAADKARKDEEKRQRDEVKRQKEEEKEAAKVAKELEKAEKKKEEDARKVEREEKKKVKEAEKQERDAEKAKKDAERAQKESERLKKEKAQLRIGAFFGRPAPVGTPPPTPDDASVGVLSRRSSMESIKMEESVPHTKIIPTSNPDFEKYIIPYFIHEHTEIAPINRFQVTHKLGATCDQDPSCILSTGGKDIAPLKTRFTNFNRRFKAQASVRQVVMKSQSDAAIMGDAVQPDYVLESIPYKVLSFREDIRPPYVGTYTQPMSPRSQRKLSRKPTYRGRKDTNYDYDSEAEWEPPADDDDDINLEDEMSESEADEEEMQDFLDDEDDQVKKKLFVGEMEPISSGLCWQDQPGSLNMVEYRMDVLDDSTTFPINPFSSMHWSDDAKAKSTQMRPETKVKIENTDALMPPPRLPLAPVNAPNTILGFASASSSSGSLKIENSSPLAKQRGRPADSNRELKMIAPEFLPAFKEAVSGSDLTKAGLIEILKKQFPKCSKDAIKDTLGVIAVRMGKKEAEKKWQLL